MWNWLHPMFMKNFSTLSISYNLKCWFTVFLLDCVIWRPVIKKSNLLTHDLIFALGTGSERTTSYVARMMLPIVKAKKKSAVKIPTEWSKKYIKYTLLNLTCDHKVYIANYNPTIHFPGITSKRHYSDLSNKTLLVCYSDLSFKGIQMLSQATLYYSRSRSFLFVTDMCSVSAVQSVFTPQSSKTRQCHQSRAKANYS